LGTPAISDKTLHELAAAFAEVPEQVITPSMWEAK
jgi:hypothetical protein